MDVCSPGLGPFRLACAARSARSALLGGGVEDATNGALSLPILLGSKEVAKVDVAGRWRTLQVD